MLFRSLPQIKEMPGSVHIWCLCPKSLKRVVVNNARFKVKKSLNQALCFCLRKSLCKPEKQITSRIPSQLFTESGYVAAEAAPGPDGEGHRRKTQRKPRNNSCVPIDLPQWPGLAGIRSGIEDTTGNDCIFPVCAGRTQQSPAPPWPGPGPSKYRPEYSPDDTRPAHRNRRGIHCRPPPPDIAKIGRAHV